MKKSIILLLSFVALFYTNRLLSQTTASLSCGSSSFEILPSTNNSSIMIDGLKMTATFTGDVKLHNNTSTYCNNPIPYGTVELGGNGNPFTYTIEFSSKVTDYLFTILGGGSHLDPTGYEDFTFTLDNNIPANITYDPNTCGGQSVVGNTIKGWYNGGLQAGRFMISSASGFNKITVKGNGTSTSTNLFGSIYAFCSAKLVKSDPVRFTTLPYSQRTCIGQSKALSVASPNATSYQWYRTTSISDNINGTLIPGAILASYYPPSTTLGTNYYYVRAYNANGYISTSPVFYVVETCPTIDTITSQSVGCENYNTTKTISVTASGTGTLNYQWYKNTVNTATVSNTYRINLATESSYKIPTSTVSGTYFYVVVSNPTGTSTTSSTILYTKETCPTINEISGPTMVCFNGTPSQISVDAIGTGTLEYQWYKNSSESNTGGTRIDGATNKDYTPPADITNTKDISYFYVVVSNPSGNAITSNPIRYSVVDCPAIISIPTAQNFCINDVESLLEIEAIGIGPLYIKWFKNGNDNNINGEEITGLDPTLMTYSATTSALGTLYYYVKISNTADFSGITITSNTIKVTITSCVSNCYKPPTNLGQGLPTKNGISSLNRANSDSNGWPMARKGAWTTLESLTKGLVINRVKTTVALDNIFEPIEGMIVYNEEARCLMIYTTADDTNYSWKCFDTLACPND